ncbi:MAG: 7-carboxy-7-deazaguanine synthase QueE [Candidatus Goldiibacteriota bacterium]
MKIKINEIFEDIEGEGALQGFGTLFIRFSGCNLRCRWCDTKGSYMKGTYMTVPELVRTVKKSPYKYINITGGEPLVQKKMLKELLWEIKRKCPDKFVSIETNGSKNISGLKAHSINMDIKPPSSGVCREMDLDNLKRLKKKDQVKAAVSGDKDMEYILEILKKHRTKASVVIQPVFGKISPKKIGGFIMKNRVSWRLGVQMHKIPGGTRGLKKILRTPDGGRG